MLFSYCAEMGIHKANSTPWIFRNSFMKICNENITVLLSCHIFEDINVIIYIYFSRKSSFFRLSGFSRKKNMLKCVLILLKLRSQAVCHSIQYIYTKYLSVKLVWMSVNHVDMWINNEQTVAMIHQPRYGVNLV